MLTFNPISIQFMKRLFLFSLTLLLPLFLFAQESKSQKEVGILFSDIYSFGLSYKSGTSKALWRFQSLYLGASNSKHMPIHFGEQENYFGFQFSFGREWRKLITPKLELRYGADLLFSIDQATYEILNTSSPSGIIIKKDNNYAPGVDLVFGFNYIINKNLSVGAEVNPFVSFMTGKSTFNNGTTEVITDKTGVNYGMSNQSVLLNLAYRF